MKNSFTEFATTSHKPLKGYPFRQKENQNGGTVRKKFFCKITQLF